MEPKFEVQMKIQKPAREVFEAVADPEHLSGYFTKSSSGRLAEGMTVQWQFPEFADMLVPVTVRQVVDGERIVLQWAASEGGYDTTVEMLFKPMAGGATMVQIRESGWKDTPKGIEGSYGNCGGWMAMMCALKAYLEYGINLRATGMI